MKRLLLLALPLALAACSTPPQDAQPKQAASANAAPAAALDAQALAAYHWRLQDATRDGQRIDALFARPQLPVTLDFKDGQLGVANTCNRMGGRYTVAGNALEIGRMASTMMACADPKLMALDGEVGTRLHGALTAAMPAPTTLVLTSASGDVLTFQGEPTAQTRYGSTGERVFLEVAAQTKPCSHPLIPDKQCLQVRELTYDDKGLKRGTPGAFQHFYDAIKGYTHEPGIRNVLRVDRYTRKDVPADASKYAYVLDMVVESDASAKK